MAYNPRNAKLETGLPAGIVADGAIVQVEDGTVRDFLDVEAAKKWIDPDATAIQVTAECLYNGDKFTDSRIFPYRENSQGQTVYSERSNLGKFAAYYRRLPQVGDRVQLKTNSDGFFKLVIE